MLSRTRLRAIARKEIIQLSRDRRSLILAFALPVLLLILFGYAITFDVRDIRMAVLDQDHSLRSRALIDAFGASGYFDVVNRLAGAGDIAPLLDGGEAQIVLVIPPDFSRNLENGRGAQVQALVDGSDANTATIVIGYASGIVRQYSLAVATRGIVRAPPLRPDSRVWYNEALTSRNMIVPGLVAVIMMIIAAMLTSLTIAREWERGTMEQLASTPVHRFEVVFGKLLPYLGIGLIDVTVTTALGVALFRVPFRGDVLLLAVMSTAFLIGSLGLGMFISAVAKSQVLATQMAMILTFLPAFLLSGFMFSIDVMPPVLRAITYIVPARYFLVVTRGVFLKGVGVEVLWLQGLLMLLFAAVGIGLAVKSFRKELT